MATLKILVICYADFVRGADTGTIGAALFCICLHIENFLFSDTEANEEFNSLVRIQTERAPNIGLPLVSSRCSLKKALNVGSASSPVKWSQVRPYAQDLLRQCIASSGDVLEAQSKPGRWESPPPHPGMLMPQWVEELINPLTRQDVLTLWGLKHSRLLHSMQKEVDLRYGFVILPEDVHILGVGQAVHLVPEKNYSLGTAFRCRIRRAVPGDYYLKVDVPFNVVNTAEVFYDLFDDIHHAGISYRVLSVTLKWAHSEALGLHAKVASTVSKFKVEPVNARPGAPEPGRGSAGRGGRGRGSSGGRGRGSSDSAGAAPAPSPAGPMTDDPAASAAEAEEEVVEGRLEKQLESVIDEVFGKDGLGIAEVRAAARQLAGEGGEAEDLFEGWVAGEQEEHMEAEITKQERTTMRKICSSKTSAETEEATRKARERADALLKASLDVPGTSVDELLRDVYFDEVVCADLPAGVADDRGPDTPVPSPQRTEELVSSWSTACSKGVDVLVDAQVANVHKGLGYKPSPNDTAELSLVEHCTDSGETIRSFVHWQDVSSLKGRRCRQDCMKIGLQLVYPTGARVEDFSSSLILHPAIGVPIRKARGALRTVVPKHVVRLKEMWDTIRGCSADALAVCHYCQDELDASAEICALCQLAWHSSCSLSFSELCTEHHILGAAAGGEPLHHDFQAPNSPVCCSCRRVVACVGRQLRHAIIHNASLVIDRAVRHSRAHVCNRMMSSLYGSHCFFGAAHDPGPRPLSAVRTTAVSLIVIALIISLSHVFSHSAFIKLSLLGRPCLTSCRLGWCRAVASLHCG